MKLTKSRLKQIIKEELQKEMIAPHLDLANVEGEEGHIKAALADELRKKTEEAKRELDPKKRAEILDYILQKVSSLFSRE